MTDDKRSTFPHRLVHLDLKGAPLSVNYLERILPMLKQWGTTGLLMEYEDTFPYHDDLRVLAASHAYSPEEIKQIQAMASENELIIIPLVQTFGHLEFVLKHTELSSLREVRQYPMALCPSNTEAVSLVCKMIDQVMVLHPNIQHFHLGCDEVYHLGMCDRCKERMSINSLGKEQLFFSHVHAVATHVKDNYPGRTSIVWDDMFRSSELPIILNCKLGDLVEPMLWHYLPQFSLPTDLWDNLSAVFPNIWVASAFKGATGPRAIITNIRHHLDNHNSWMETLKGVRHKFKSIQGIALTGWQRYDHFAVLCELFPHGLPSLALCLRFIQQGTITSSDFEDVCKGLRFSSPLAINPFSSAELPVCEFPGSAVYLAMIEFVHLEAACNEFFSSEGIAVWMHDYNVSRGFINPVHVEPFLARANSLQHSLQTVKNKISPSFSEVFVSGVDQEWKNLFVTPLSVKLTTFIEKAKLLVSEWETTDTVDDT